MTLASGLLDAIARTVHRIGGDVADVEDLVRVWERLERAWCPRVDRLRYETRTVACTCADGGDEPTDDGRCSRCFGVRSAAA